MGLYIWFWTITGINIQSFTYVLYYNRFRQKEFENLKLSMDTIYRFFPFLIQNGPLYIVSLLVGEVYIYIVNVNVYVYDDVN